MLRDLLETAEFKNSQSKISFAAGKDIAGKVVVADIAKMPHHHYDFSDILPHSVLLYL